jgi:hypothetical protein
VVPDGIRAVRTAGVLGSLGVVRGGVRGEVLGFDGGGVLVAAGGVSSTGYGLSALMAVVSVIEVSVSVFFWHAESPMASTSNSVRSPAERNNLMTPPTSRRSGT